MPEPVTIAAVAIGCLTSTGLTVLSGAVGGAIGNPTDRVIVAAIRGFGRSSSASFGTCKHVTLALRLRWHSRRWQRMPNLAQ